MKKYIALVCTFTILCFPTALSGQLIGGDYEIYGDTFSFVSGNDIGGSIYTLYQTGGEFFAASSGGGDYMLRGGFRAVEIGILRVAVSDTIIQYGELTEGVVNSSPIAVSVWTDSATGYTLYLREDQDPTSSNGDTIADVTGSVVDGTEEAYGVRIQGDDAIIPSGIDIPVTATAVPIATTLGEVHGRTTDIEYRIAVTSSTPHGIYSHTLIHTVLVNP